MSTTEATELTFLFTDIEGSTRLWSRVPVAMAAAVQRQEALLRDIVTAGEGSVFKTVGDGAYAVFAHAVNAVRAAVAAQRALLSEPWHGFDQGDTIQVRIAVHTGPAEARDGDYFGPALNRLSRTLAAGHGGQILCTDDTLAACGDAWPPGIDPRDLGARTLRDVSGSGRIFQLVAEGLPEHFPPLATLDPRVHNLPRWPTPLIDRQREQERIRQHLRSGTTPLVTLLGTGGVGKTRLATEAAAPLLDEFQDGIRFVDLSALRDDAQVIPAIVQATGAADQLLDPRDALLEWLRPRQLLLVLDNCEQVIGGVASITSDILNTAPRVEMLATSRAPIRVRGERQVALEPLPLPESDADSLHNPAVRLFAERASEVNAGFTLNPETAATVSEICQTVDGLPLAIELAAAWVRILTPDALQRRLQESRAMLRDGARDLPDRQRALASTIAWSYDLLESEDRRAFRRLAVFRGGIGVDAAAAVLWQEGVDDPLWAITRLDALVQANLLRVTTDPSGEPRFVMLQTIQEFAEGVLRSSGEWEDASAAHAEFFMELAQAIHDREGQTDDLVWLSRLDVDLQNLNAAIEFIASSGRRVEGLRMILLLETFLDRRDHVLLERHWYELTYDDSADYPPELRIDALFHIGNTWHSDPMVAGEYYRRSIEVAEANGETGLRIRSIASLSIVAALAGDYASALSFSREVLDVGLRESSDRYILLGYHRLAYVACEAGMYEQALAACHQARSYARELGDEDREAWGWVIEARVFGQLGDANRAVDALRRARRRFEETGNDEALAICHLEHGLALLEFDLERAKLHLGYAAKGLAETIDAYTIISTLEGAARLLISQGECALAAESIGAAQRLRERVGITATQHDKGVLDQSINNCADRMEPSAFESSIERGRLSSPRTVLQRFASLASRPD